MNGAVDMHSHRKATKSSIGLHRALVVTIQNLHGGKKTQAIKDLSRHSENRITHWLRSSAISRITRA